MNTLNASIGRLNKRIKSRLQFFWRYSPAIIIILAIICRIPLLYAPTVSGFQHTDWRQTDTASIAHNFLHNDFNLLYPQINWGGNGPGYVETEFQLYPFITALLYQVFGEHIWLGLLVSLLFSIGTFIFFYAFVRRLVSRPVAVLALLFFTVSPLDVRYSVAFMPEATVLFFYMGSLYFFHKWLEKESFAVLILAATSTALAILVKPTSIHVGIIFFVSLFQKYHFQIFRKWQIWLFVAISLSPGILWYLHARNLYLAYGNTFGIISGGDSKFDNLKYWSSPSFYTSLLKIDVEWLLTIGGVLPFLIGIGVSWHKRQPTMLWVGIVTILAYYMLIPRYTSFADYYHIYALPFTSLAVGLGIYWLFQNTKPRMSLADLGRHLVGVAMVIIVVNSVFRVYRRDTIVYVQELWECSQHVTKLVPQDTLIIVSTTSSSTDGDVPNNYQEPQIFFYSQRYGWSLPSDWHNVAKLEEYQGGGGQYFVIYDKSLYESSGELVTYLQANAQQIGPGIEAGCGIYKFNSDAQRQVYAILVKRISINR